MKHTHKFSIAVASALLIAAAGTATGEEETMLEPGMPFPSYELPAHDGTTVTSADFEGAPYLLFFYPKADTGG